MDIKILRYFLALVKEETVTGAAEYLHLTQPTLSRQLSELEEELGVKLFVRGSRKITLTEEGSRLARRAEEIVDLVDKTESDFLSSNARISGNIYIGAGETHVMEVLTDIMRDIQKDYPQVFFHIFSGDADEVKERLDKGLLDFGLLVGSSNISKYDSYLLPKKDSWGVLMRKDSLLSKKLFIEPQDIWDLPLITSKQKYVDTKIEKWIKRDYKKLNIVGTYNLIFNASLMVEKGIGYALCLDKLVNTSGDSPLCFRLFEPTLEVETFVIWKKYQLFSQPANLFLKYLNAL